MSQEKTITSLAKKYANRTASQSEILQVEAFFNAMQETHKSLPIKLSTRKKNKIKRDIDKFIFNKTNFFSFKNISIAASILLLVGLGFSYSLLQTKKTTVTALKGERKEVLLADGSTVFLNANSSITYADNFKNKRYITLKGEAFFKVARNTENPFVITANNTETEVLGTSFNINSTNENKTIVSVNTGKVLVRLQKDATKNVLLTKNQQVTFLKDKPLKIKLNNSDNLMAWTRQVIILNTESLERTSEILENWYNVKIIIEDDEIKHETISGKFKNETLKNVMKSIALLKNLEIDYLTPNHITIRKKTPNSN